MSFPSPLAEEECTTISGQQEPVITFLLDRVKPASPEENSDQYSLVKERLSRYGYVFAGIDDNIMQISRPYSPYFTSYVYCKADMLVGMSMCTKEDFDFAECIRACFRVSMWQKR